MTYRIFIIAGLLGLLFSCEREMSPEQSEKFIKFFGNYLMDEARDVEVLEDGGYAICGIDSLPDQGKRMVLIVTDKFGNVKTGFPQYYSEAGLNSGANTLVVKRGGQGGYLLCGYVERPVDGATKVQKDMFLVRTSSSGQEIWQRSYGSSEDEVVLHAAERVSSGFMLAGYQVKDGKSDILIMGVDQDGDSIRLSFNYNNPFADNAAANFILNTGDGYLCVCTYDKISDAGTDILILNFDDELNPNAEYLKGDIDEFGRCIIEDGPDRYLVLGNRINISGRSEMVIHLIETDGLLVTKSLLLATISEQGTDLIAKRFVKTTAGSYAIVGTRQSDEDQEIFLQFLSSEYSVAERVLYGSTGDQSGADIDLPENGGIILLGTSDFERNSMISLIKTDDSGNL
ncbi:MAG: hypothetical protein KAR19_09595 [Bacteroidales bacterium]|nr:hypothetical protein [Bacteroidales bacterium]